MNIKTQPFSFLVALAVGAALLVHFGRFIELSGDFVQHFMLVDEIMKHGYRRAGAANLGGMAVYPDGAHWIAAVIGWIGGSGLVAIVLMTVAAVYASYLLILELAGRHSPISMALCAGAFWWLASTGSLVGWEVSTNYFFPQLVADVALLGVLVWLARAADTWRIAAVIVAAGALAMFVHALISLQILAVGMTFLAYRAGSDWYRAKRPPVEQIAWLVVVAVGAALILKFHPSFLAMRKLAENNGYLEFSYSNVQTVVLICAAIGAMNLWMHFRGKGTAVDGVLGCASLATAALALLQYAVLNLEHVGSEYAVKKHMFVVVTLGALNVVRLIAQRFDGVRWPIGWLVAPLMAGYASTVVLTGFNTPVLPVIQAINYANHVATFDLPDVSNVVDADSSQPPMINFMISASAFQQPFGVKQTKWIYGADPTVDAMYAMVRRTPEIDARCKDRFGESATYVVVAPGCLKN